MRNPEMPRQEIPPVVTVTITPHINPDRIRVTFESNDWQQVKEFILGEFKQQVMMILFGVSSRRLNQGFIITSMDGNTYAREMKDKEQARDAFQRDIQAKLDAALELAFQSQR